MGIARVGELDICWEETGTGEPMILIMGIGSQLVSWPDGFCDALAGHGLRVIRFDNRDAGRSSVMDHLGVPDVRAVAAGEAEPPYTLGDMASDAIGLLDVLGIDTAHVVGLSLGGVVAQVVAVDHMQRVRSLGLLMTHPGRDVYEPPTPEGAAVLTTPRARTKQDRIEQVLAASRVVGSKGDLHDEQRVRDVAARAWDRGWHPDGFLRQLAAIVAHTNRLDELSRIGLPTVVVHGEADGLVPLGNARILAEAIPGADLVTFPDMGHDLPEPLWQPIAHALARNAGRA